MISSFIWNRHNELFEYLGQGNDDFMKSNWTLKCIQLVDSDSIWR